MAIVIAIFSFVKLRDLPVDILPEFQPPTIEIQTEALGLSASEVENLVTLNIEEMLSNTPWLKEMRSKSVHGLSSITLIFQPGADIMDARQMVAENLMLVNDIPNVSQATIILQPRSTTNRIMAVGLVSDDLSLIDISQLSRWKIRPALLSVPGVANVSIWGHRERQMQVRLDQEKMRRNRISLDQIIKTTGNAFWMSPLTFLEASTPGSGGWIDTPNQRLGIRHSLPIRDEDDLAKIPVSGAEYLALGDVAETVEGHQPLIGDAVLKDGKGILLVIEKYPDNSVLKVTQGIENKLDELKTGLAGIEVNTTIFRPATFIETAIDSLTQTFLISAGLIIFILSLFFYRLRIALLAFLAMALSLLMAFFVLYLSGVTANAIMLAGILASLGIIIDQMIIGFGKGTRGTIYATLIVASLVLPVFFIQGEAGLFFSPLALAYIISVFSGMVVSLIVFPSLVAVFSLEADVRYREFPFISWLCETHKKILTKMVEIRTAIWVVVVIMLVAGSAGWLFLKEHPSLLPAFQEQNLMIELESEPGTSLPEMNRIVARIGGKLQSIAGVGNLGAHIGRAITGDEIVGIESAKLWISIDQSADYKATKNVVAEALDEYPQIVKGMKTYSQEIMEKHLSGVDKDVFVRIYGPEFDELNNQAEEVKKYITRIEGVVNPSIHTTQSRESGIEITVDLAAAKKYGIKPGDVRRAAATAVNGIETGYRFEKQKVYQVMVWSIPEQRNSVSDIKELLIDAPNGGRVRLADVADVHVIPTLSRIEREAMSRYIDIGFNVKGRDNKKMAKDIENALQEIEFPLEYHAEVLGEFKELQRSQRDILLAGVLVIIAVFLLLQSLFNSWRLATLSFVTIPTALSGGILAVYFFEEGVSSLGALVGFLTILGLTARNGIMMIDHFQYLEKEGGETFGPSLVLRGAKERLRPILMTAFTTGAALVPLVVAGSIPGLEIEYPMALVILGGLVTSTLLNIFIVPALYLRFGKKR